MEEDISSDNINNSAIKFFCSTSNPNSKIQRLNKINTLVSFLEEKNNKSLTSTGKMKKNKKKNKHKISLNTFSEDESDEESILDTGRLKSLVSIIMENYKEEKKLQVKQERLAVIREKIWRVVRKLRHQRQKGQNISNIMFDDLKSLSTSLWQRIVMHPELSLLRQIIDFCVCGLLLADLIISSFEYLMLGPSEKERTREIIFDSFFFLDMISQFFTSYFKDQIIITQCRSIAFNYLNFKFLLDLLCIFPFWVFTPVLIYMRLLRIYRFPFLIRKIRYIFFTAFSFITKSLKRIHSFVNIIIFSITLFYILHFSACIWVLIGKNGDPNKNWLYAPGLSNASEWEKYTASIYFLIETFTTIGYGDLTPKNIFEICYIMICEVLQVGLFAYLISCIVDIINNFSTDEISFKYNNDIDISSWMIKYNYKIPSKMRLALMQEKEPIFYMIEKYFLLFHSKDHSWIKKFYFLEQMRPQERNVILEKTFNSFFKHFNSFFNGLDFYFRTQVALSLRNKFFDKNSIIISESASPGQVLNKNLENKNKIKYFYFIAKGSIGLFKQNYEVCRLVPGSYFGDEYLVNQKPQYTYKVLNSHAYLFCCPVDLITKLCSFNEDSYLFLLYKTLARLNKFKLLNEENLDKHYADLSRSNHKKFNSFNKTSKKLSVPEVRDYETHSSYKRNTFSHIGDKFTFSINSAPNMDFDKNFDENQSESVGEGSSNRSGYANFSDKDKFNLNKNNLKENFNLSEHPNTELDKLLEDHQCLDKIEINDEKLGNLSKLNEKKEKFNEYLKYIITLGKKLSFLKTQLEFIKFQFGSFIKKSDHIVKVIQANEEKLFQGEKDSLNVSQDEPEIILKNSDKIDKK